MGCGHYFVADRLEALVDEDDSRSYSRVREHGSFLLVSQLHAAIQTPWSRCLFPRAVWTNRVVVHFQRASPFLFDLRLRFRLRLCLYLNVQQTLARNSSQVSPCLRWCFRSQTRHLFSLSWVSEPDGCSLFTGLTVFDTWVFGFWLDLLGVFTTSNFWTQFFHPIVFKGNLWRRSRWRKSILVFDFSSFDHNSFRDTISWECVVKDDCVRSCLIELNFFLLSKLYFDPIHRVFWSFFQFFCLYHARRGASRSMLFGSLFSLFIGSTDVNVGSIVSVRALFRRILSQREGVGCQIKCARLVWKQGQQLYTSASVSSHWGVIKCAYLHSKEYRLSFAQNFVLPIWILNSWWSVNWLHIQRDKMYLKKKGNLRRRPRWRIYFLVFDFSSFDHNSFRDTISWECVVKDDCVRSCSIELKWDCVLNDLEELGDKEFLVLMDQYSIELFSCCLRLLPLYSSTFHQTNVESAQDRSEDIPLISRIQSLHFLL